MTTRKAARALDTARACGVLLRLHLLFRLRGSTAVARRTAAAMRVEASSQAMLDARRVDAWHTARAVWRANRLLPLHSTCLQVALAMHDLFERKGCHAVVRVGVRDPGAAAHAWVEIGDFVLDDQRLSTNFLPFEPGAEVPL
ncbi:MAG: lasso peptide biosynthesis B2 protein [Dehalococcoidia bacterium]|nr:lasso peptide biosynthesis B2 protein [Dehalococcoidia bacterium]